jgi:TolB-like protein
MENDVNGEQVAACFVLRERLRRTTKSLRLTGNLVEIRNRHLLNTN